MNNCKKKKKMNKKLLAVTVLISVLMLSTLTAYAYFSTRVKVYTDDGEGKHVHMGMSLDLLFDMLNQNLGAVALPTGETFDATAEWGSAANPYIISDIRHMQNLSVLQECGYFYEWYIKNNYENGAYNEAGEMPYFLVCKPDGTPVTIDGTNVTFSPIGTDEYPFIGYIGGAFAGTAESKPTTTVNGKSCEVSVIHNLTVQTTADIIDVGLFGTIGYLGVDNGGESFKGVPSTVENLVLSDIKVVAKPSLAGTVDASLHRFVYSLVKQEEQNTVPHEDHHIGILAGHVENANVNYISVYYSADDIVAISMDHQTSPQKNYASATGIIGFIYNMNPKYENGGIYPGTGTSSDLIGVSNGIGTGGGKLSGTGRGYVVSSEIYEMYHRTKEGDLIEGDLRLLEGFDENGNPLCTEYVRKRILWGTENTGLHYFYDGVFTFALSTSGNGCNDKIESTWKNKDGTAATSADTFSIGENDDNKWEKNTSDGKHKVIAFVKDIKSEEELKSAISDGKQIYIGYEQGGKVSLISLAHDYKEEKFGWGLDYNNKFSTDSITRPFVSSDDEKKGIKSTLEEAKKNEVKVEDGILPVDADGKIIYDVITNFDSYRIIDLGEGYNPQEIKEKYTINAKQNGTYKINAEQQGTYYQFFHVFDNGSNCYLAMLDIQTLYHGYSIYTGTEVPEDRYILINKLKFSWVQNSRVEFNGDTATILYTTTENRNQINRYIYAESSSNGEYKFKGDNEKKTTSNLRFYVVAGTSNLNYGHVTYDPSTTSTHYTYGADQAVLWPMTTYSGSNGRNESTDGKAKYAIKILQSAESTLGTTVPKSDKSILTANDGWKNKENVAISTDQLKKKFKSETSATWGATLSFFRGDFNFGSGTIVAPVGSLGVEANIPIGTVAFRVNKNASAGNSFGIRVIVSVPQCDYYNGEGDEGTFYTDGDHYFGLWHMSANGEQLVTTFTQNTCMEKFELPRSNTFKPDTSASSSDYILIDANADGSIDSRCYLNAKRVLVAYEFKVTEEGVYVLGSTNGPMEIVYFSADATASGGRDGTMGSTIGSIDFVYDYSNKIVPVTESSTPTENGEEDYKNYYSSLCLLYINSSLKQDSNYVSVDQANIYARRYVNQDPLKSMINFNATGKNLTSIELLPYGNGADTVNDLRPK